MNNTPVAAIRLVEDWTALETSLVQIRRGGQLICEGTADYATPDGKIIWVRRDNDSRKLFEQVEAFEVWAIDPTDALNYRLSNT